MSAKQKNCPQSAEDSRQKTKRKRAEKALRENEETHRALIEGLPDIVMRFDREGRHLFVSDNVRETMGMEAAQFIGKTHAELGFPEVQCRFREECIRRVFDSGAPFETELTVEGGAGPVLFNWRIIPERDAQGAVVSVLSICRDITERKRIENSLLESEEMQRKLLQTVPDLIVRTDMEGTILFVNDFDSAGFENLRGQVIYGKNILSFVAEHDAPRVLENLQLRLVKNPGLQEYQLQLGDHAVVDVEINGDVIRDESENPLGMVFVIRDITSRKWAEKALRESEERFKTLHNASFGGIFIHNLGVILDCNQGLSAISGFDQGELIGMDGLLLIAEQSRDAVKNNISSSYEKPYEAFGLRKNGEEYPLRIEARNMPYNGKMVRVVEFRDITEHKQAQMALQQKNEELEQFVYSVSHDLKSPLITVKSFAGMLRQDLLNADEPQINEDLNFIDKAADKMQQLLDALLRYSRIGRIEAPVQTLAAGQQVEDCLSALAGILQRQEVQVSSGELSQRLQGDPLLFGQIWQNLIENAVKYMGGQTHPHIEIGATQQARDVIFYVRDNGMGIAPEHSERIFNLFSQLNPASEGSGLGLALVKKIVSLYRGRIWAESVGEGKGSCFMFTLPGALVKEDTGP